MFQGNEKGCSDWPSSTASLCLSCSLGWNRRVPRTRMGIRASGVEGATAASPLCVESWQPHSLFSIVLRILSGGISVCSVPPFLHETFLLSRLPKFKAGRICQRNIKNSPCKPDKTDAHCYSAERLSSLDDVSYLPDYRLKPSPCFNLGLIRFLAPCYSTKYQGGSQPWLALIYIVKNRLLTIKISLKGFFFKKTKQIKNKRD